MPSPACAFTSSKYGVCLPLADMPSNQNKQANPFQRQPGYFATPYVSESLGTLLCDFLWHFSIEFPFSTAVMSPRDGKLYSKVELEGWSSPSVMNVQCLVHPGMFIKFDFNVFLIPQDNNVTEFVNQRTLETLIGIFRTACHDILRSTLDDKTILGKVVTFHGNVSVGLCTHLLMLNAGVCCRR